MSRRRMEEFELEDCLGVGTVGSIYRARDSQHDCDVALKILLPTVSSDPLIKARFEREMIILNRLSHKNIVRYFGGGRDGAQLFYAMELVDGGTIKDVLERSGRLSWQEAATCGVQICSALQYAHNYDIVHRDLKPSNLYLTEEGELKLGDFGIALDTTSEAITSEGLTVGTYAYMSPEQITGDRSVTGKTDLYALGCLLFELLAGRPPFEGANFAQLFEQHLHRPPPRIREFVPNVPEDFEQLLLELLCKSADGRPFSARSVQVRLMHLLDQTLDEEDLSRDVPADAALDRGRAHLSSRLSAIRKRHESRDVSWTSLACLALAILGVVCAAWAFGS